MNFRDLNICWKKSRRRGNWRGIYLSRNPSMVRAPCCSLPHRIAVSACITRRMTTTTDFLTLLRFLENGDAASCKEVLADYRAALPAIMTPEGLAQLRSAKEALEQRLRRVMARTE